MEHPIDKRTKAFALRIIKFVQLLHGEKKEFVLSKQILRSGTSIGANVRERKNAQSKADFVNKLAIALKEADENTIILCFGSLSFLHEIYSYFQA